MESSIFIFGLGYVGSRLANRCIDEGWKVGGSIREVIPTKRSGSMDDYVPPLSELVEVTMLPPMKKSKSDVKRLLKQYDCFLFTAPVNRSTGVDPFLSDPTVGEVLRELALEGQVDWAGYLSTTSVYGDQGGSWVDEDSPPMPTLKRGHHRVQAELSFMCSGLPIHIFRLPGIYGPGRGPMAKIRKDTARCIVKEGQVFSRIHVDDIVGVIWASLKKPNPGRIYNVVDDEPVANHIVIEYACELIDVNPPPRQNYSDIEGSLTAMAKSFYQESKRVRNNRIKQELCYVLRYKTYREGLQAQLEEELANGWMVLDVSTAIAAQSPVAARSSAPKVPLIRSEVKEVRNKYSGGSVWNWIVFDLFKPALTVVKGFVVKLTNWVIGCAQRLWLSKESWRMPSARSAKLECLLIDNGSLKPEPTKQLRVHASELERNLEMPNCSVSAVSARYSDRIEKRDLNGIPAKVLKTALEDIDVEATVIAIPYFLGPSTSVTTFIPKMISERFSNFKVTEPLVNSSEGHDDIVTGILCNMIVGLTKERNISHPCPVVLVDHGSPNRNVNRVRRALAARIRSRLVKVGVVSRVVDCSMERREGDKYMFNDPLLENVFDIGGLDNGDVILAMGFLAPGKHAGPGGDIEECLIECMKKKKGLRVHQTGLIGDVASNGKDIVRLLRKRVLENLII